MKTQSSGADTFSPLPGRAYNYSVNTSLFELFKIGIGPSSSHTVGPMRAALRFARELETQGQLPRATRLLAELYGSLALTGLGHSTDRAVLLGFSGCSPESIDPATIDDTLATIRSAGTLSLLGQQPIPFQERTDLLFHRDQMSPPPGHPAHPNGLRFTAFDATGAILLQQTFFSVGGGFIVSADELANTHVPAAARSVPYPFLSARELLATADLHHLSIADLMLANELALLTDPAVPRPPLPAGAAQQTPRQQIEQSILALFAVMQHSVDQGLATEGILPGGLHVRRRAPHLAARLRTHDPRDPLAPMDWVTVYAMAVNEENAAGGRVVTAPTNGAAGVLPAIALYLLHHAGLAPAPPPPRPATRSFGDNWDGHGWGRREERSLTAPNLSSPSANKHLTEQQRSALLRFFLTAAAIGILYKENASISGAEVGCQGEVGVACSMAAGGLVAALGGSNAQIEHAAEIAMEHNLGMTCDPIGGLVQIPCIERNGMGAVKAINAARLALADTETHKLSLDQVIETMYRTGLDMQSRYKETSLAGLALNIIEC